MPISFLLRKILNKLRGKTPAQAEMEYLCSQGLIIGSNFRNHSDVRFRNSKPNIWDN